MKIPYVEPRLTLEQIKTEVMQKYKIGQPICIIDSILETTPPKVRIHKFYPNFVQCKGKGYLTCYSYFDLWKRLHREKTEIEIPAYLKGVV